MKAKVYRAVLISVGITLAACVAYHLWIWTRVIQVFSQDTSDLGHQTLEQLTGQMKMRPGFLALFIVGVVVFRRVRGQMQKRWIKGYEALLAASAVFLILPWLAPAILFSLWATSPSGLAR